jgi:hypothetical protein
VQIGGASRRSSATSVDVGGREMGVTAAPPRTAHRNAASCPPLGNPPLGASSWLGARRRACSAAAWRQHQRGAVFSNEAGS